MPFDKNKADEGQVDSVQAAFCGDQFWNIYPAAFQALVSSIRNGAGAGPVRDAARRGLPVTIMDGIATIPVFGVLTKRPGYWTGAGYDQSRVAIDAAVADPEVKKILLHIDSPGGCCLGLSDLGDAVRRAGELKQVVAYVDGMGASAAYYIASQADKIYTNRTDMVGSIGTILVMYDFSEMLANEGIKPVIIDTGKFKHVGVVGSEITDEHKEELQKVVDFYFQDFVSAVMRGRNMSKSAVTQVADGRMFPAPEAKELGLVDGISGHVDVLNRMRGNSRKSRAQARLMMMRLEA